MRDAVIVEAVRTPVGKRRGGLSAVHPADLSAHVLRALQERSDIDPALVDVAAAGSLPPEQPASATAPRARTTTPDKPRFISISVQRLGSPTERWHDRMRSYEARRVLVGLLRRWRARSGRLGRCVVALVECQH